VWIEAGRTAAVLVGSGKLPVPAIFAFFIRWLYLIIFTGLDDLGSNRRARGARNFGGAEWLKPKVWKNIKPYVEAFEPWCVCERLMGCGCKLVIWTDDTVSVGSKGKFNGTWVGVKAGISLSAWFIPHTSFVCFFPVRRGAVEMGSEQIRFVVPPWYHKNG